MSNPIMDLKKQSEGIDVDLKNNYKDTLFKALALYPPCRKIIVQEFLGLKPEDVDEDKIKEIKLEDSIVNNVYNDVSLEYNGDLLLLVEHQSSVNRGMPLRMLIYYLELIKQIHGTDPHKLNRLKIHTPKFVVFYKGNRKWDTDTLKLSDSFINQESVDLSSVEVVVDLIKADDNNSRVFPSIFRDFVDGIIEARESKDVMSFVKFKQNILKSYPILDGFFDKYKREEMFNMLTFEDKLEAARNDGKEEGRDEGRYEGRVEDREEVIYDAFKKYIHDCIGVPSYNEFVSIYGFMIKDEFVEYTKSLFKYGDLN